MLLKNGSFFSCNEINNTPLAEIEKLVFFKFYNSLVEDISNNLLTSFGIFGIEDIKAT